MKVFKISYDVGEGFVSNIIIRDNEAKISMENKCIILVDNAEIQFTNWDSIHCKEISEEEAKNMFGFY